MLDKILTLALAALLGVALHVTTVGATNGPTSSTVVAVSAPPATPAGAAPSLPPNRVHDCVTYALLDDMCTKRWYTCKRGGSSDLAGCIDAFESCCTLRGQGARSRLGGAEAVTTNR
jgi:hypothetical protein